MSSLLLTIPMLNKNTFYLNNQCEVIKDILIKARKEAKQDKKNIEVQFYTNSYTYDNSKYEYYEGVTCSPIDVIYNAKGDVNMANTITCTQNNKHKEIVIHLGNGDVQIK